MIQNWRTQIYLAQKWPSGFQQVTRKDLQLASCVLGGRRLLFALGNAECCRLKCKWRVIYQFLGWALTSGSAWTNGNVISKQWSIMLWLVCVVRRILSSLQERVEFTGDSSQWVYNLSNDWDFVKLTASSYVSGIAIPKSFSLSNFFTL